MQLNGDHKQLHAKYNALHEERVRCTGLAWSASEPAAAGAQTTSSSTCATHTSARPAMIASLGGGGSLVNDMAAWGGVLFRSQWSVSTRRCASPGGWSWRRSSASLSRSRRRS